MYHEELFFPVYIFNPSLKSDALLLCKSTFSSINSKSLSKWTPQVWNFIWCRVMIFVRVFFRPSCWCTPIHHWVPHPIQWWTRVRWHGGWENTRINNISLSCHIHTLHLVIRSSGLTINFHAITTAVSLLHSKNATLSLNIYLGRLNSFCPGFNGEFSLTSNWISSFPELVTTV